MQKQKQTNIFSMLGNIFSAPKKQKQILQPSFVRIGDSKNQQLVVSEKPIGIKWIQVIRTYNPSFQISYPYEKHKNSYDQLVYMYRFRRSQNSDYEILFKPQYEVIRFLRAQKAINDKKQGKQQEKQQGVNLALRLIQRIQFKQKEQTNQQIVQHFYESCKYGDKSNLKVLGQFKVGLIDKKGCRKFLTRTLCRPCRRSDKVIITITTECILFSQEDFNSEQVDECIPLNRQMQIKYNLPDGGKYSSSIRLARSKYKCSFHQFSELLRFACVVEITKKRSHYFEKNRFDSFCQERLNCAAKFYADGEGYFSDLHDQIQKAKHKICITGWCITPYFLLKRPQPIDSGQSRLDKTLLRAAQRGVKIFIIVYQESSLVLNNDSFNVQQHFLSLHQNFRVLRHPGIIIPQLWSHHQKSVIIDEKVGFMGGLDICYGRWDNHQHSISDIPKLWDGADYSNQRLRANQHPRQFINSHLKRDFEPRMPWHDVALQIKGPAVIDLQRHFVQYWYFAIHDLSDDPRDHVLNLKHRYQQHRKTRAHKQLNQLIKPNPDELDQILVAFSIKTMNQQNKKISKNRMESATGAMKDLLKHKIRSSAKQVIIQGLDFEKQVGSFKLHLCRSSSHWSTGIRNVQHSIEHAYQELIQSSRELIYIQNQFFMSYENQISEQLARRIRRAHENKEKFKIIVVLPLMPGFQGDVTQQASAVLRIQMYLQYQAIKRDKNSVLQLINYLPRVEDYIYFFGLRNHALMSQSQSSLIKIPKTQIIYVHSKMMIVDDNIMIMGSANINDRSLLGSRDSQLAIVVKDQGQTGQIFNFRAQIFQEHFGINRVTSANIHQYWHQLIKISKENTLIYRTIFGCLPDDTVLKNQDVTILKQNSKIQLYDKIIHKLVGHYVDFPIDFLSGEDLSYLKMTQIQNYAPMTSFT